MSAIYSLDLRGVLFHPEIDRLNRYTMLVYNWKKGTYHKVNSFAYDILNGLEFKPGMVLEEISKNIALKQGKIPWQIEKKIADFLAKMIAENVVIAKK